ncbi:MAG: polysaccharide biosynthesis tyrosine autokinase [Oscillospiraceae bacterium]|nr:polysaccharide biosynthesis tyrosine autokinase [Oscillospiraceae bacterium]
MQQEQGGVYRAAPASAGVPPFLQLDYGRLLRAVIRRIWVVILAGIAGGSAMYYLSKQQTYTLYSTETILAFTIVTYNEETRFEGTPNEVTIKLPIRGYYYNANPSQFGLLLQSDAVMEKLSEALNGKYSEEAMRGAVGIVNMNEPAFFKLFVQHSDPSFCNEVLNALVTVFPDYLKRFETTLGIETVRRPRPAVIVDNSDRSRTVAIYGAVIGCALTMALFLVLEMSKTTIRSAQDIRSHISERMLGMTPFQATYKRYQKKTGNRVPNIMDKRSVGFDFIENIKALRTKLENTAAKWDAKIFAVSSTFENEGKTTLSLNIACAMAQKGKNVLLIDCDLRKPALMKGIGVKDSDSCGILPILTGKSSYEDSVKYVKSLRLFVLSTGGTTANPTEMLSREPMARILQKAREEFDYVIIDTPPSRVVSDCIALAPYIEGLIYAIRYDYARAAQINETLDEISGAGIKIVGTVLTMAASERILRRGGYYANYRRPGKYYGGYGYGYGYTAEGYGYYGQKNKNGRKQAMDEEQ